MNPEQALSHVADAIKARTSNELCRWSIIWSNGDFRCIPAHTVIPGTFIIENLSSSDVEIGLTPHHWNILTEKIAMFFKELKK